MKSVFGDGALVAFVGRTELKCGDGEEKGRGLKP